MIASPLCPARDLSQSRVMCLVLRVIRRGVSGHAPPSWVTAGQPVSIVGPLLTPGDKEGQMGGSTCASQQHRRLSHGQKPLSTSYCRYRLLASGATTLQSFTIDCMEPAVHSAVTLSGAQAHAAFYDHKAPAR
ncbi:hypothetical protein BaRGS_00006517 [Batillaria attramentaria]|uniref:Uncharacterized protein n=1 Tax=Batillaria attramentaria TaxID=370345 RepID=A0ABD0LSK0_9CAEN